MFKGSAVTTAHVEQSVEFDLYERIAKRLWNPCYGIHGKQRRAGNREVLVGFGEQHVNPLPVLCHPLVPKKKNDGKILWYVVFLTWSLS